MWEAQARLLGLPTRLSRSDLHVVKPHQKVLELPGTGRAARTPYGLTSMTSRFTTALSLACDSWQELTLAGIVALELSAASDFA